MDLLFLQLAVLLVPYIISHFINEAAISLLSDEEKSLLIDTFSTYRLVGLILFFVPMAFIYNNLMYVSLYAGIFIVIMLSYAIIRINRINLPKYFMQRYYLSKAIFSAGILLYFLLFWIKYFK